MNPINGENGVTERWFSIGGVIMHIKKVNGVYTRFSS